MLVLELKCSFRLPQPPPCVQFCQNRSRFGGVNSPSSPVASSAEPPPEQIARELVRALRGRRSQEAFAKRLGYASNVPYLWEAGRRQPSASRFLSACQATGIDVWSALGSFLRAEPPWLQRCRTQRDPPSADTTSQFLTELRGQQSIIDVARSTGKSRFRVARWFSGDTEPRLPDFLAMVHATSFRLPDFVAALVDPEQLPSLRESHRQLQAARQAAFTSPWCHAVLRLLETQHVQRASSVTAAALASELGLTTTEVEASLRLLETTQQIARTEKGWDVRQLDNVDTASDPEAVLRLKAWAARVGLERLERNDEGLYSYNLFCVSRKDYDKIQALHRAYFRQVRAIVAESKPSENVVLMNLQLFKLSRR